MPWYYAVAERDHEIQNPTSAEKIRLLGDYLRLTSESRVLDLACGKAGPALVLAATYGCRISGIERMPEFADAGRERIAAAGLDQLIDITTADASEAAIEPGAWDAVLCLGASFIWGTLVETAAVLQPAVRPGGFIAVGEPYWRRLPLPDDYDDRALLLTTLEGTVTIFETEGLPVVSVIASSEDDWDNYETLHWKAVERWLAEHADDPEAEEIRTRYERHKRTYLRHGRDHLGWAIFVGWKPLC